MEPSAPSVERAIAPFISASNDSQPLVGSAPHPSSYSGFPSPEVGAPTATNNTEPFVTESKDAAIPEQIEASGDGATPGASGTGASSAYQLWLLSTLLLSVLLCLRISIIVSRGARSSHFIMIADTMTHTLFSLSHSVYALGRMSTCVLFLTSAAVSWAFEQAGVITGAIYGRYYFTDRLGMKVGHVPLIIPLAWFMMIYPSYILAGMICCDRRTPSATAAPPPWSGGEGQSWASLVLRSAVGGIIMTGWDMTMDPRMVQTGHWVWIDGGPYFGVPIQNFAGWFLTTFSVYFIFGAWERCYSKRTCLPAGGRSDKFTALHPLLAFASVAAMSILDWGAGHGQNQDHQALCLIAVYSMGFPVLIGFIRLFQLQQQSKHD